MSQAQSEVTLGFLVKLLWQKKFQIIIPTVIASVIAVLYAINKPNVYTAQGIYTPASQGDASSLSKLAGQFGGLASLAGVNLGGAGEDDTQVAIKFLKSRAFLQHFIDKYDLTDELMAVEGWNKIDNKLIYNTSIFDPNSNTWNKELGIDKPTPWNAYEVLKSMLSVNYDSKEGVIEVSLTFYSPVLAKKWLELLIQEINKYWREKKIAKHNLLAIALEEKAEKSNVSELRSVFYSLIAEQTKNSLLAEVTSESVFESVGDIVLPQEKSAPSRALICLVSFIFSFTTSLIIVSGIQISRLK